MLYRRAEKIEELTFTKYNIVIKWTTEVWELLEANKERHFIRKTRDSQSGRRCCHNEIKVSLNKLY